MTSTANSFGPIEIEDRRSVRQDKYQVGDSVEWRNRDCAEVQADCGPGPFIVQEVQEVKFVDYVAAGYDIGPDDCRTSHESVGHTQWLIIPTDRGAEKFSGHWFKPLR